MHMKTDFATCESLIYETIGRSQTAAESILKRSVKTEPIQGIREVKLPYMTSDNIQCLHCTMEEGNSW